MLFYICQLLAWTAPAPLEIDIDGEVGFVQHETRFENEVIINPKSEKISSQKIGRKSLFVRPASVTPPLVSTT